MRTSRRVSVAALLLATVLAGGCGGGNGSGGGGLPEAADYARDHSDQVVDTCKQISLGNFGDFGRIRSDLRALGTSASEAEIEQRANEIRNYIADEKC